MRGVCVISALRCLQLARGGHQHQPRLVRSGVPGTVTSHTVHTQHCGDFTHFKQMSQHLKCNRRTNLATLPQSSVSAATPAQHNILGLARPPAPCPHRALPIVFTKYSSTAARHLAIPTADTKYFPVYQIFLYCVNVPNGIRSVASVSRMAVGR